MKVIKFSKPYNDLLKVKSDLYKENKIRLDYIHKINLAYKNNPKRFKCKNCDSKNLEKFIKSFNINYNLCKRCGHLNGDFQDTKEFTTFLYQSGRGKNYAKNYLNQFNSRVQNIYVPKAIFLKEVLKSKKLSVLDFGCGAGHFLKALEIKNIYGHGIESNKILCDIGNKKLKKNRISYFSLENAYNEIKNQKKINVISLISVLEHLEQPNEFIKIFKKSCAEYLYICVPLFSLSVFLENSFPKVFPRQLSAAHTHLYTKESLYYLAKKFNLKIVAEWWFGTDFPDLHRSLINSAKFENKKNFENELNKKFFSVINQLQNILDKNKICSEVHMIFKK